MKLPMKWISEYAPINMDAESYMNKMIMIGNGVEGYDDLAHGIEGIVVGKVMTCEAHPDSDHLHVTTVDVGGKELLQIVCGAPNCEAGILVPVATVGAKMPDGTVIKRANCAASNPLACSAPLTNWVYRSNSILRAGKKVC